MNRSLALLIAILLTSLSMASTGLASGLGRISFAVTPGKTPDLVRLDLREGTDRKNSNNNSSLPVGDLVGLDPAVFRSPSYRPVRFALVRPAGRLDCAGNTSGGRPAGECRFSPDARFVDLLVSGGIERPDPRESYAMAMVGVTPELVQALHSARYPVPTISELTGLAALGVPPTYVAEIAARGHGPRRISDLLSFKALGVTPEYLGDLHRAGLTDLSASDVAQLKALGVTGEFVAGFDRLGYSKLSVAKLVQAKALGVTPDFVERIQRDGYAHISADELIRMKISGLLP